MYGYDYEEDILLILRLFKFLYDQNLEAAKRIAETSKKFTPDEMYDLTDMLIWEIFNDVVFDSDPETEASIVTCSHPSIDRLFELGPRLESARGRFAAGWLQKISDIVEFFICGASNSLYGLELRFLGSHVEIELRLSPDCYEPIQFGNSLLDVLLYVQRENARLEQRVRQAEEETENEIRKEAA